MTSVIEITNPKICAFFNKNPQLQIENLLLPLMDIIDNHTTISISPHSAEHNTFQVNELNTSIHTLKTVISNINKSILTQCLTYKTEYVNELKTFGSDYSVSAFMDNNRKFIQKIQQLLYSHLPEYVFKHKYTILHDKILGVIRQFQQVIDANIETIFAKNELSLIHTEFVSNFELNSSHMIQSIQHLLNEFVQQKSDLVGKQIQELSSGINTAPSAIAYSRLNYELNDFLHSVKKYNPQPACPFETIISQIFPTASLTSDFRGTSDFQDFVLSREQSKPVLYISSCSLKDRNINAEEIKEFNRNVQQHSCHGILISQYTGITSKPHFYIDIHVKTITVYLHNHHFSEEKLKIAADIIDHIHSKLSEFVLSPEHKQSIPKECLDDINREYQNFISQRETLLAFMKDTHKKMISQVSEIAFPALDKYLSSRYSSFKKQGFLCDICGVFNVPTLKGLAAHKRGCNRKNHAGTHGHTHTAEIMETVEKKYGLLPHAPQ